MAINHSTLPCLLSLAVLLTACAVDKTQSERSAAISRTNSSATLNSFDFLSNSIHAVNTIGFETLKKRGELTPECELFFDRLEAFNCGIDVSVGFARSTIFVPSEPISERRRQRVPPAVVFMTDKVPQLGNDKILMFVSSESPQRTTIIEVSKDLRLRLLYDAFCKNDLLDSLNTRMDALRDVRWISDGVYLLEEREIASMSRAADTPRTFRLSIANGGAATIERAP